MRFLADENIPSKLSRFITSLGHDIIIVPASTADIQIIEKAGKEDRTIVTLDRDFEILAMNFSFNAIVIRIHPPYSATLIKAFQALHKDGKMESIDGLNILTEAGLIKTK